MLKYFSKTSSFFKAFYLLFLFLSFSLISPQFAMSSDPDVLAPHANGLFYPSDPSELRRDIQLLLNQSSVEPAEHFVPMVLAPHAGYKFSGAIAADSFKAVSKQKPNIVIFLAPSHFFRFDGISIWDRGGLQTPLGVAEVETALAMRFIRKSRKIVFEPRAYEQEHSVEVLLPFVQHLFPDAKILPVVIGEPSSELLTLFNNELVKIIDDRKDILVVISSGFSHYHTAEKAESMDKVALDLIQQQDMLNVWIKYFEKKIEMSGFYPVIVSLLLAKEMRWSVTELLSYAHSGEVIGETDRVVGYASLISYPKHVPNKKVDPDLLRQQRELASLDKNKELTLYEKRKLMAIAKESLHSYVKNKEVYELYRPLGFLKDHQGVFVSLKKGGELRGSSGRIVSDKPLYLMVRDMAVDVAHRDRQGPVLENELKDLEIEIAVLSKPQRIKHIDQILLDEHGVVISKGLKEGFFLPGIAKEKNWTKEDFLNELCSKSGMEKNCWQDKKVQISVFTSEVFSEADVISY